MTEYVILFKWPANGRVAFIRNEEYPDEAHVMTSEEEAEAMAQNHPLLKLIPYQIVPLEI